jgi:hypothetical protein
MLTAHRLRELLVYDGETGVFAWRASRGAGANVGAVAGTLHQGYRKIRVDGVKHFAHRLAWLHVHGEWPAGEIDHVNGDKLDNRIANLRDVTRSTNKQNMREARADSASGFLGVLFRKTAKRNPYAASIMVEGRRKHLGQFPTPDAAHAVYVNAKRQLHAGCTI